MSCLIDTNVLLRRLQPAHPMSGQAAHALQALRARGESLYLAAQNVVEFWGVVTRPVTMNGLGLSPVQAKLEVDELERLFAILPDAPGTYARWRHLVAAHAVSGRQVHDTHLVAAMLTHGVTRILTFNDADFARFGEVTALNPATV